MNKTILLAEDEAHVLRVLCLALERAGYTVATVANGALALERVRVAQPDVLITDIEMPKLNGRELCETIAREFPRRRFPIFIMTSRTELEHREWSGGIPDAHFLEKPISVRRLVALLQKRFAPVESAAG